MERSAAQGAKKRWDRAAGWKRTPRLRRFDGRCGWRRSFCVPWRSAPVSTRAMQSEAECKPARHASPLSTSEGPHKVSTYHSELPSRAEDGSGLFPAAAEAKVEGPMMQVGWQDEVECGGPTGRGSSVVRVSGVRGVRCQTTAIKWCSSIVVRV